jgi:hypothetical protein
VAPGGLRDRLTFRHWRVDRPLDGGLARQPALCIESRNRTAQDQRRRRTVERPSEAATGSSRRIVNRVRRCSPVKEWIAGVTAGPGEAGWNPVDAHTRRPSWRSPFDPIEGDAPRRGDHQPESPFRKAERPHSTPAPTLVTQPGGRGPWPEHPPARCPGRRDPPPTGRADWP